MFVCAAVIRWNAWECPVNPSLSRHYRVTCDLLESHTGTTITNTPHLRERQPKGEDKWERARGGARERQTGEEEDGTQLSITHTDSRSFCLFVFVCFCLPRLLTEVRTSSSTTAFSFLFFLNASPLPVPVIWIVLCPAVPHILHPERTSFSF